MPTTLVRDKRLGCYGLYTDHAGILCKKGNIQNTDEWLAWSVGKLNLHMRHVHSNIREP